MLYDLFIPSAYMKNLFILKDFMLTDWQVATIIWNAPNKGWQDKVSLLNEHVKSINDEKLRKQLYNALSMRISSLIVSWQTMVGLYM